MHSRFGILTRSCVAALRLRNLCHQSLDTRPLRTMTASDLLQVSKNRRRPKTLFISDSEKLWNAMRKMAENQVSELVVVNKRNRVVGMLNQKDLLRRIVEFNGENWDGEVSEISTPSKDIIHVSPQDTLDDCRAVMTLSGRSCLPVLAGSSLLGVVSLTDIASLLYKEETNMDGSSHSAKSDYITMILPRKGLPKDASIREFPKRRESQQASPSTVYRLSSYAMSIPHPRKLDTGGEDAFFIGNISSSDEQIQEEVQVSCIGIADGVGSWFEQGIDPSKYAITLMEEARNVVSSIMASKPIDLIHPAEVLSGAWNAVTEKGIVGSSTACIVSLDEEQGELYAANLGDSGFLIVRDKRSDHASAGMRGTLDGSFYRRMPNSEDQLTPAGRRKGAHVSYRSPQQLHYFNCPYQLGRVHSSPPTDDNNDESNWSHSFSGDGFETPRDASMLRVPVMEGDLIILATDGLFDNMEEEQLLAIVSEHPEVPRLAKALINKAHDLSLSEEKDSPFARLAKENDILWSGGMPDDITVIVARVVKVNML